MEGQRTRPPTSNLIRSICIGEEHLRIGLSVPDGLGHFSIRDGEWAYCSAGRPTEPHEWFDVGGIPSGELRHDRISEMGQGDATPQGLTEPA